MRIISFVAVLFLFVAPAFSQRNPLPFPSSNAVESVSNAPAGGHSAAGAPKGSFASGFVLFDNGSMVNHVGTGFGGADESRLQTNLGMGTYGFAHAATGSFRVADDFTVSGGDGWDITAITFFAYQTGSTTTSTINSMTLRIWDGVPGANGSNVIWGNTSTNVLASTTWTGIYRTIEGTPDANNRPIMANTVHINAHFAAGTYYLDWNAGGTLGSGPWAAPVTIEGATSTGNGLQFDGANWVALTDVGAQGLPFLIEGAQSVPTLGEYGLMAFISLLLAAGVVFMRRLRTA